MSSENHLEPMKFIQRMNVPYVYQLTSHRDEDMIRQIAYLINGFEDSGDFVLDLDLYTYQDIVQDENSLLFDEAHSRATHLFETDQKFRFLKTQQTAPATMCHSLRNSDGKKLVSERMFHLFVTLLTRLAAGQVEHLSKFTENIILCQDDPALGFVLKLVDNNETGNLSVKKIMKGTDSVYPTNIIASYHCCDDWRNMIAEDSFVLWENALKILHIDVLSFPPLFDNVQAESINKFLENGGGFALGVLPNIDEGYTKPVMDTLNENLETCLKAFSENGVSTDLLSERVMISTQCGLSRAGREIIREIHEKSSLFPDMFSEVIRNHR